MAKSKAKLDKAKVNSTAAAFVEAERSAAKTMLDTFKQLCKQLNTIFGGANEFEPEFVTAVQDKVQAEMKWKENSKGARRSEVKAVMFGYPWLPEAMDAYDKRTNTMSRVVALKLARAVYDLPTVSAAVTAVIKGKSATRRGNKRTAKQRLSTAVQNVIKDSTPAFRKEFYALLSKHKISYTVA